MMSFSKSMSRVYDKKREDLFKEKGMIIWFVLGDHYSHVIKSS